MKKATLMNQMRKARQAGDREGEARLREQLAQYQAGRQARRGRRRTYRVKRGDNYFSIAKDVYGDARYVVKLAKANKGLYQLSQGMVLQLPPKDEEEPWIAPEEWEDVLESERKQTDGADTSRGLEPPATPDRQTQAGQPSMPDAQQTGRQDEDGIDLTQQKPSDEQTRNTVMVDYSDSAGDGSSELDLQTLSTLPIDINQYHIGSLDVRGIEKWKRDYPEEVEDYIDKAVDHYARILWPEGQRAVGTPAVEEEGDGGEPTPIPNQLPDTVPEPVTNDDIAKKVEENKVETYRVKDLPLDKLTDEDVQLIGEKMGLTGEKKGINFEYALEQMDLLQKYWGKDNQEMIQIMREINYPDALDLFISGAKDIDSTIFAIDGNQNGISESDAAKAVTLLLLSSSPGAINNEDEANPGFVAPLIPVYLDNGESGMDHVIAGLDAYYRPIDGDLEKKIPDLLLDLIGKEGLKIESLPAVTYQGDLAGAVQKMIVDGVDEGYKKEMTDEDFMGDIMANVIVSSGLLEREELTLAEVIQTAYDLQGEIYPNRHTLFVASIGLEIDPQNGTIRNRDEFLNDNHEIVRALGIGLYSQRWEKIKKYTHKGLNYMAEEYSDLAINKFLNKLEEEIMKESGIGPIEAGV